MTYYRAARQVNCLVGVTCPGNDLGRVFAGGVQPVDSHIPEVNT